MRSSYPSHPHRRRILRLLQHMQPASSPFSSSTSASSEVITTKKNGLGTILLNRPKALNALTVGMVRSLHAIYHTWNQDPDIKLVIMKGAGGKAFCAGGDVVSVRRAVLESNEAPKGKKGHIASDFFREEYQVNYMIFTAPKLQVSLWDGFVMGGGVGLSMGSKFRIATEKTVFAMPETAIGLFPDVGGTYWLPRLPGGLGPYIGLTGARMNASDLIYSGIATHYVPSARLPDLESALGELSQSLFRPAQVEEVNEVLRSFVSKTPLQEEVDRDGGGGNGGASSSVLAGHREVIDQVFAGVERVEEMVARLKEKGKEANSSSKQQQEWASKTLKMLEQVSPTSLKVTLKALRLGATLPLEKTFPMEYRLSQACMHPEHDFMEGVRAVLVNKDNQPKWNPPTLEEVTGEMVQAHFAPLPTEEDELKLDV